MKLHFGHGCGVRVHYLFLTGEGLRGSTGNCFIVRKSCISSLRVAEYVSWVTFVPSFEVQV